MTEEKQENVKESPKSPNKRAKARFERESMVVYKTFFNVIMSYKDENLRLMCFVALFEYGIYGIEPETDDDEVVKTFIAMAKPLIDKNIARYDACKENGKKGAKYGALGGAPKGNKNACKNKKQPQKQPQKQPLNVYDNDNDNVNDNDNDNVLSERDDVFKSLSPKDKTFFLSYKSFKVNARLDPKKHDIEAIKIAIKDSKYLQASNMMFVLKNYDKVINGFYDSFKVNENSMLAQGLPTGEDFEAQMVEVDDLTNIDFDEPDTRKYARDE